MSDRGASLHLSAAEKFASIKLVCHGFGDEVQVRQDPSGRFWCLKTPAQPQNGRAIYRPLIEGLGETADAAIEDAWSQFTAGPFVLSVIHMVPRRLQWDGIRFCDV